MRQNKVKALWREGKPACLGWMNTADTYVAEVMANAGFDALVLDMQHGMAIGPDRAALWLQAVSTTDTVPLVRVPWNEPFFVQYVLDAGAYGVIVPLINNRAEAEKAAGACRYPPLGYRSNGPNRVVLYGGSDYFHHANEEIICLLLIEHAQAVANLDDIAGAPGIDGFYIGPTDLAISMGLDPFTGVGSPPHEEAVQRVLDVAHAHGLVAGAHPRTPEEAARRVKQGFDVMSLGAATGFMLSAARSAISTFRNA
ncbi:MAG: aldolase/citrate lyase family protein [Bacteroidetes bacterium]|nr:aldolase/citrate lyase family protein [Bacteroidota bacterium]MCL5026697.1 aldolase/citrate lyase family protein [Chloroflexota bacterium]